MGHELDRMRARLQDLQDSFRCRRTVSPNMLRSRSGPVVDGVPADAMPSLAPERSAPVLAPERSAPGLGPERSAGEVGDSASLITSLARFSDLMDGRQGRCVALPVIS